MRAVRPAAAFWRSALAVSVAASLALGLHAAPGRTAPPEQSAQAVAAPADVASYRLSAVLDPTTKQVLGTGRMRFTNPGERPVEELWVRLYLNAFRSASTPWMREAIAQFRGAVFDPAAPGSIDVTVLRRADTGRDLALEPMDEGATIARVQLDRPLDPGATLDLDVAWTARLPRVFARTGFGGPDDRFFMVGQWYPKFAAFDRGRWDTEPWHANAEFFHDFGTYDLEVTAPAEFVIGASGVRVGEDTVADGQRTARFRAEGVTDVAWTAWPGFSVVQSEVDVGGRSVQLEVLLPPAEMPRQERHVAAAARSVQLFSRWYGAYPWPKLTVVVPPPGAEGAGGMEYPTLVATGGALGLPSPVEATLRDIETVTVHEVAHQWFPMQVQSNEAREAWLDEGFSDYLTIRALRTLFPGNASFLDLGPARLDYADIQRAAAMTAIRQPLTTPSWEIATFNRYGAAMYGKGSSALLTLEGRFGDEPFTAAMRAYADGWRWQHPTITDFQDSLRERLGADVDLFFEQFVRGTRTLDYAVTSLEPARATVMQRGDGAWPVAVALELADGTREIRAWDGADALTVEPGSGGRELRAVAIDPERRVAIETERLDNARTLAPDAGPRLALVVRWMGLLQALLQAVGQVG
ncbi:MAG: M1 family metallopeptidase [Chloroflexi bacterium]|nr:M1 family metallopeptidase [Chloroflexota bacterium]